MHGIGTFLLLAALSAAETQPQDRLWDCLEPERGIFDPIGLFEHSARTRKSLGITYRFGTAFTALQMVSLPSFSAPSVVSLLRLTSSDGRITTGYSAEVKVARKKARSAPLHTEAARAILELWEVAINRTGYPARDQIGLDGTEYHFWIQGGRSAQTWSPDDGTMRAELVRLGERLAAYVDVGKDHREIEAQAIRIAAEGLMKRLKTTKCAE